jgi:hypothetical protein
VDCGSASRTQVMEIQASGRPEMRRMECKSRNGWCAFSCAQPQCVVPQDGRHREKGARNAGALRAANAVCLSRKP